MPIAATTSYTVQINCRHPHTSARIHTLLSSSEHDENFLTENDYDVYECSDELEIISVSRIDQLQVLVEYESKTTPNGHQNFINALTGFSGTSVRVLEEEKL